VNIMSRKKYIFIKIIISFVCVCSYDNKDRTYIYVLEIFGILILYNLCKAYVARLHYEHILHEIKSSRHLLESHTHALCTIIAKFMLIERHNFAANSTQIRESVSIKDYCHWVTNLCEIIFKFR
jgi:hypothetical protein